METDGIQMFCLICFKVIRLDRSLLAADFSRLGINRLAAMSSQLQQAEAASSMVEEGPFSVCERCEAANEPSFQNCFACGHASRLGRLMEVHPGKHRTLPSQAHVPFVHAQSMGNLRPVTSPETVMGDTSAPTEGSSPPPEFKKAPSSYDLRFRTSNLLRNSASSGMGNRLTLINKVTNLFIEASALHGVDQPMCKDCFKKTDKVLHSRTSDLRSKSQALRAVLAGLDAFLQTEGEDAVVLELEELEREVAVLEKEDAEQNALLQEWNARAVHCTAMVQTYELARDELTHQLLVKQELMSEYGANLQCGSEDVQRLSRAMPLNDVFHIWFDGQFGTICSHRLGRTAAVPVDWSEINAAWGMAVLLLQTLGRSLGCTWTEWEPVPMGVFSKMRHIAEDSLYDVNFNSDLSLGRVFWYRKYDYGVCGFLHCVGELVTKITMEDPSFVFPYAIAKERIGPAAAMLSVRYQFSEEPVWTRAMKYLLTTLKFLIAWLAKKRLDLKGLEKR